MKRRTVCGLAVVTVVVGLGQNLETATASCRDRTPTSSSIRLAPQNEPGERLVIEGRVIGANGRPLAGIHLYAYHADASGMYVRPGGDSRRAQDPRLCGVLLTDANGGYRIETIRPSTSRNLEGGSPHVHFELWGAGHSVMGAMLTFREQRGRPAQDKWGQFFNGVRTATERPIVRGTDGVWHCVRDFRLR